MNEPLSFQKIPECRTIYSERIYQKKIREVFRDLTMAVSTHTEQLLKLTSAIETGLFFLEKELQKYSAKRFRNGNILQVNPLQHFFSSALHSHQEIITLKQDNVGFVYSLYKTIPTDHERLCTKVAADCISLVVDNITTSVTSLQSRENLLQSLLLTLRLKDPYTYFHSQSVQVYAVRLGEMAGLSFEQMDTLRVAGLLHDIGKISIPTDILQKPGSLSDLEYDIMKKHPQMTFEYLNSFSSLQPYSTIAFHHHEHFSGGGYPGNIAGEEIPLESRILAIADAYDAMTGKRIYRKPMPSIKAISEIVNCSPSQFDPYLSHLFYETISQNKE